ncbi:MAG: glycine betaine ABC transporter substrate-binding protein [Candidatus Bipolaricaulaceae bacterium]
MRRISVAIMALLLIGALGFGVLAEKRVVVGCKNFTEQYIIGELMAQLLEDRGFEVERVFDLSSMALREGMEAGDIDVCADYTGTAWMVHLGFEFYPGMTNTAMYYGVKGADAANGFVWLNPIWNNNTYALASWPEYAEEHGLETLSDLADWYNENDGRISTFIDFEFSARPDGLPALESFYGFHVAGASLKTGAPGASLMALANRQVDVAMVFATDATIAEHGWYVYKDDKSFFPPYDLTPYVRANVLEANPEIADILNELVATFPCGGQLPNDPAQLADCVAQGQAAWQELNAKVDIDKMEPDEAAREYLLKHGLIEG